MALKLLYQLDGHEERVWCVDWSPSSQLFASCGGDKTIRIWGKSSNELEWEAKAVLEGLFFKNPLF